jgi:ATP-dependent RNA helicase DeaD
VHRIGRTGRAGRSGNAILFVAPREMRMLKAIERATRQAIESISLPTRGEVADRRVAQFKQQILEVLGEENLDFFYEVIRRMESEDNLGARQIAAALAFMAQRERPLQPEGTDVSAAPVVASPRPERSERPERVEHTKQMDQPERAGRPERVERADREDRPPRRDNRNEAPVSSHAFTDGQLQRYRIEVGRNQGATPKEIVGAIANEGGIEGRFIGQIHLFDDYSTVELPAQLPNEVLSTLKRTRVKQKPLNIRALAEGEAEPKWERRPPAKRSHEVGEKKPPFRDDRKSTSRPFKSAARPTTDRGPKKR